MLEEYQKWFEKKRTTLLEDFFTYLSFPSISTDPAHKKDILACKDWLQAYLKKMGMDVEVWETSGHPTIFASSLEGGEGAPTVLFYGHYDVQPSVPLNEWKSEPFKPEVRDGNVYARGAIDSKGQGFYTLLGVQAFLEMAKNCRVNIKILMEGEEEVGSPGLESIAEKKREALQADHVFIVDLDMYDEETPAVTLGIRGISTLNVTVRNATADLHSGVYGGVLANPARVLSCVLAKMWDEKGKVAIPHFYEGMKTFSKEELKAFDWNVDVKEHAAPYDAKAFQGEAGYSLLESNWIRPTIEINGMESGYTGEGSKTIIPAKAMVKLSCRLVEGQNPQKVVEAIESFLIKNLPEGIEVRFERGHGASGMLTSPHSQTVAAASEAYERVFDVPCRRILCGATIPIVPMLSKMCGGELVMIGMGLSTDGMHSPNECIGLKRFEKGFLSITQILEIISNGV